jgi:predicted CoA-binding protein
MTDQTPNDPEIMEALLRTSQTIAVLGMSDKASRASHHIGAYLAANGYRVLPVNPMLAEVLGMKCFATLEEAQASALAETGRGIDLVDVFRASEYVSEIVDDVIRLGIPGLWLQDGVQDEAAIAKARTAGVQCVQNDCIYRRHAELSLPVVQR